VEGGTWPVQTGVLGATCRCIKDSAGTAGGERKKMQLAELRRKCCGGKTCNPRACRKGGGNKRAVQHSGRPGNKSLKTRTYSELKGVKPQKTRRKERHRASFVVFWVLFGKRLDNTTATTGNKKTICLAGVPLSTEGVTSNSDDFVFLNPMERTYLFSWAAK